MSDLETRTAARTDGDEVGLQQYGALPWRLGRCGIEVLLITSRRRGRWIVPKGWLVKGRSPAQSAAREAFEEAGRHRPRLSGAGRLCLHEVRRGRVRRAVAASPVQPACAGHAHHWREKEQRQRRWYPAAAAPEIIAEPDLARLVHAWQSRLAASAGDGG